MGGGSRGNLAAGIIAEGRLSQKRQCEKLATAGGGRAPHKRGRVHADAGAREAAGSGGQASHFRQRARTSRREGAQRKRPRVVRHHSESSGITNPLSPSPSALPVT
jgi:hypothetical protein